MSNPIIILDNVTYTVDQQNRTIEPFDNTSAAVLDLMDSGEPVGPQVDEWIGLTGTWDTAPMSVIAAFMDVAENAGVELDWFSDDGTLPPDTV